MIARLRQIATHPAARGLADDAAVLPFGGGLLVLTHDLLVEGVHYLPDDPPETVAAKLVAVNLSDLAAKGARPIGLMMGYTLTGTPDWDARFMAGLEACCARLHLPLLGGDTVAAPHRVLGLTALGEAESQPPARDGARPGDALFVTGVIGDAGAGLALLRQGATGPAQLIDAYRLPEPQLAAGRILAPQVSAMMDVSDGLLIDAARMADASGVAITIDLAAIPLSSDYRTLHGEGREARLKAATAGDDYQLLYAAASAPIGLACDVTCIGTVSAGAGLSLRDGTEPVVLPSSLGWEHQA